MVDKKTYDKVKSLQNDGITSKGVSSSVNLDLETVNNIFGSGDWNNYQFEFGDKNKIERVYPAQSGYYKSLIAKKKEENGRLGETRDWLAEQVNFLRKSIAFLETRKRELEDGIKGLEKNIGVGISMMESLEEFKELSKDDLPKLQSKN